MMQRKFNGSEQVSWKPIIGLMLSLHSLFCLVPVTQYADNEFVIGHETSYANSQYVETHVVDSHSLDTVLLQSSRRSHPA